MEWISAIYQSIISYFSESAAWASDLWQAFLGILDNLDGILNQLWVFVEQLFYMAVNMLIQLLATLIVWVAQIMPNFDLPQVGEVSVMAQVLSTLNWIFPVSFAVECLNIYVISTIAWATVGIAARWLKISG